MTLRVFCICLHHLQKASFLQYFGKIKNPASCGAFKLCGERGIRTPGAADAAQRFSRPPHSTTLPFLPSSSVALAKEDYLLSRKAGPFLRRKYHAFLIFQDLYLIIVYIFLIISIIHKLLT